MQELAQQIVSGLATGSIFASMALALVIIYRSMNVINFAQGEMALKPEETALNFCRQEKGVSKIDELQIDTKERRSRTADAPDRLLRHTGEASTIDVIGPRTRHTFSDRPPIYER